MAVFILYLFKSAVLFTIFYIFFKAFLSNDTFFRFNRRVILSGTILCILLPLVQIETEYLTAVQKPFVILEEAFLSEEQTVSESLAASDTGFIEPTNSEKKKNIPFDSLFTIFFCTGLFIHLIILGKSFISMLKLIYDGEKSDYGEYKLIVTDMNIQAFSWGKYIVISKQDYLENPNEILSHEKAHIKLKHSNDLLFFELVLLLQWFNPVVWLLKKELKDLHEYQADIHVLQTGIDATRYQLLLVKKAVGSGSYTFANSFNHSKIKKRITMMLKEKSNNWGKWKLLLLLPAAALVMYAFAQPRTLELESLIPDEVTNNPENTEIYSAPLKTIAGITARYIKTPSGESKLDGGLYLMGLGNDTIYAFADGIVSISEKNNKFGNHIILKHENELESLYAHNSQNLVKSGNSVKSGDPIGIIGNKRKLYFEILKDGESVNPMEYLGELGTEKKAVYYFKEKKQ